MPSVPIHHTATTDAAWDAGENEKRLADDANLNSMYAWKPADEADRESKSNWKFPHHMVSSDGKPGAANMKACSSGIGNLHGGRGGMSIPEADRAGVEAHLNAHLNDGGKGDSDSDKKGSLVQEETRPSDFRIVSPSGNRLPHVVRALCEIPWAIMPAKLQAIIEVLQLRASGIKADEELLAFFDKDDGDLQAAKPNVNRQSGAVAVLPMYGTISQRMSIMSQMSGSTSTEKFGQMLDSAINDPSVKALVIDCDSPGGTISGVDELATKIFQARGKKPMIAQVNSLMASAAYWICSACDEIACTPTGAVGSIGVFAAHQDFSEQDKALGIKTTLISAGKFKTEGNEYEPLDDEARAAMQAMVDEYYGMFVKAVARNRGASAEDVRDGYGQGRVLTAGAAVKAGLADKVATLDQTLMRLGATAAVKSPMSESMMRRQMRAARYGFLRAEEARG